MWLAASAVAWLEACAKADRVYRGGSDSRSRAVMRRVRSSEPQTTVWLAASAVAWLEACAKADRVYRGGSDFRPRAVTRRVRR